MTELTLKLVKTWREDMQGEMLQWITVHLFDRGLK